MEDTDGPEATLPAPSLFLTESACPTARAPAALPTPLWGPQENAPAPGPRAPCGQCTRLHPPWDWLPHQSNRSNPPGPPHLCPPCPSCSGSVSSISGALLCLTLKAIGNLVLKTLRISSYISSPWGIHTSESCTSILSPSAHSHPAAPHLTPEHGNPGAGTVGSGEALRGRNVVTVCPSLHPGSQAAADAPVCQVHKREGQEHSPRGEVRHLP